MSRKIILIFIFSAALNEISMGKTVGGITTVELEERIEEIENLLKNNLIQLKDESLK